MHITILDRSNYYRGLLLLARKDRRISEVEVSVMMRIGRTLGFDQEFCQNAIHEILENKHVDTSPPVFSSSELAGKFLKDGLTIAAADGALHEEEEAWLRATARANGIDETRLDELKQTLPRYNGQSLELEVDHFVVEH